MPSSPRRLGRSPARRSDTVYQLDALVRQYLDHHRALGHSTKAISHYQDSFASFHRSGFVEAGGASATCPRIFRCPQI